MTETPTSPENVAEIGKMELGELMGILDDRETVVTDDRGPHKRYNGVGWAGNTSELNMGVKNKSICPAAGFAIVSEGIIRYERTEPQLREDTDSMRSFANALKKGVSVYETANEIAKATVEDQIKRWIESHGGEYAEDTDWGKVINDMAIKLKKKADAFDEVNR